MQDAFPAAELTDGYQLDGYRIESPLSAGAMGAVYRAVRSEDETPVAVKRLLDTRHIARFEIEARLLSTLNHPRVVNVVDYYPGPGTQHDGTKRGDFFPLIAAKERARRMVSDIDGRTVLLIGRRSLTSQMTERLSWSPMKGRPYVS